MLYVTGNFALKQKISMYLGICRFFTMYSQYLFASKCLRIQSTPLHFNRKYAKILFDLHNDSNFQVARILFQLTFFLNFVSRGSVFEYGEVFTLPVFTESDVDCT